MGLNQLFGGAYSGRRVLVTGHTGFKGSWLVEWLRLMGAQVAGLGLDPDTNPSHWTALDHEGIQDHRVDLRDANAVRKVVATFRPEMVFHLAAQPLVRRSYREPSSTFDVNVMGLVNLLEAVRTCATLRVFVNATTDKVYEDHSGHAGYRETDPLGGHDPYSSSKACAELVSACYRKCYFGSDDGRSLPIRLATARAGNVIGGGDWAEDRLVPDLVRAGSAQNPLKIRNPDSTRPWQHVLEPLSGYLRLGHALLESDQYAGAWNFGPGSEGELSVRELAARFTACWPALRIEHDGQASPHEAAVLRLNCDKALQELSWQPVWGIETAVEKTGAWYRAFHDSGQARTTDDIASYVADAQRKGLAWAA